MIYVAFSASTPDLAASSVGGDVKKLKSVTVQGSHDSSKQALFTHSLGTVA